MPFVVREVNVAAPGFLPSARTWTLLILFWMIFLEQCAVAFSQPPAQNQPVGPAMAPKPAAAVRSFDAYPPSPFGFFRGNAPSRPDLTGFYYGWLQQICLLGIFYLQVWTWGWIATDATGLKVRPEHWNTIALLAGVAGILLLLCAPYFLLGLLLFGACYGGTLAGYVPERNRKVPESSKVLTKRHIRSVTLRTLARLGIKIGSRDTRDEAIGPPITFLAKSGKGSGDVDRSRQVESSRGYLAAKELVYDAILRRATDIHLEPKDDELSIRLRIDGVMYPAEPFDRSTGDNIINILKVLGGMDITERRKAQDGSFRAETEGREIDFRAATQGTQHGEKVSLRILDQSNSVRRLGDFGLRKKLLEQLVEVIKQPHGLFLSCGPTGAGKSTTLYAALQELNAYENNIITIEDPVEYKMEGVTQIEINTKADQTFAKALRSILRQDPDIVMVGEIRDGETAQIACQAANTGHMVLSTIHANDTITALFRLIDLGVEPFMLSSSISAIIGQRLCRKLCQDCKVTYKPSTAELEKAGIPVEQAAKIKGFSRPPKQSDEICATCNGLGYYGRMGVYELLVINDRLRDLIREKPNVTTIRDEARKNGMLYMKEEGVRLVLQGITSLDELLRVVK